MRKKLFFATAVIFSFLSSAQILESDNYNAYTAGTVTSSMTAAGQGGMRVGNGSLADYRIVQGDATGGRYLQITGGNNNTQASLRYVIKNVGLPWPARIPGNNIITESVDIFTGLASGQHVVGVTILKANRTGIVGVYYDTRTRLLKVGAWINNNGQQGFYYFDFVGGAQIPPNTWVNVGCSYNKTTGEVRYKIGNAPYITLNASVNAPVAGLDPAFHVVESVFLIPNNNMSATTFGIDNYRVEATTEATLGLSDTKNIKTPVIGIGPNPTTDYINVLTDLKINKAEVFDMSGRKIDVRLDGNKIDVKGLNSGSYIITVETKEGKTTNKFIKK